VVLLILRTIAMSNQNIGEVYAIPIFFSHYLPTDILGLESSLDHVAPLFLSPSSVTNRRTFLSVPLFPLRSQDCVMHVAFKNPSAKLDQFPPRTSSANPTFMGHFLIPTSTYTVQSNYTTAERRVVLHHPRPILGIRLRSRTGSREIL